MLWVWPSQENEQDLMLAVCYLRDREWRKVYKCCQTVGAMVTWKRLRCVLYLKCSIQSLKSIYWLGSIWCREYRNHLSKLVEKGQYSPSVCKSKLSLFHMCHWHTWVYEGWPPALNWCTHEILHTTSCMLLQVTPQLALCPLKRVMQGQFWAMLMPVSYV